MTLVRADRGKHRLTTGPLVRSQVGRLTNEQLEDASRALTTEIERLAPPGMARLDAAALTMDLKAVSEELALRAIGL